ncbi:MAG: tetratricopeptide repeat protein [Propionivibrio sp.]|uniref:nuclear transport factor 2 family protein n=1 Tax=Propionivibrio sp. TaxID=2212460 RepID=UPI001A57BC34|nr:tetratricopeptide repeat protein [Propionivibrio sp.]MBL8413315.1 tetratricopeptide repeat protein [Propionivibrio sp.]
MRPNSHTPSLAGLSAIILGLALSASVSFAHAQTLPEIQRLMKQNQMPQALEKVDIYISGKPKDAQGRFLRGLILTEMGRPTDAIAVFTKLTEDFPELPEPYNNLAVLYAQQKQYDKARAALEMAIRTNPGYSIAYDNLGDVYAKLASQAYDKALQLDSSNTATQTKMTLIKELIRSSSKPGVKTGTASTRPSAYPVKAAAKTPTATPAAASTVAAAPTNPPGKPLEKVPEPSAAADMPEAGAPDAPPENSPLSANGESEVSKALQGWASAWSRKDVKSYLGYYANDFQTPNGIARKDWEAERTQSIEKPDKLQVSVDEINVSLDGDKATVRFRQHYTSPTLTSSASKTVVFVKSGGKWLIQQERG